MFIISFAIFLIAHLNDITYYDGKISILIWTLMAGLKCIVDENSQYYKKDKVLYYKS